MKILYNNFLVLLKSNIFYFFIFLYLYFLPKINDFIRIHFIQNDINHLDTFSQMMWL